MTERQFVAECGEKLRLDVFLSAETGETRSYINRLNADGHISVNGKSVKCGYTVRCGDVIDVSFPSEQSEILPEDIPLDILYEDEDIAVINKAQGISVHPSGAVVSGTLVNALLYKLTDLSTIGGVVRPGIVHRLDKNTSGVMAIAKNNAAHLSLSRQIADRTVTKIYRAVLEGAPKADSGTVRTQIARDTRDRKKMAVVTSGGRDAITEYKVLKKYAQNSYVEFNLHTGRTHQIRVHAKYLGCPVVGDAEYGFRKQRFKLDGQLLHSYELEFAHPRTGQKMRFTAPLPEYFERVLTVLEIESGDGKITDKDGRTK